MTDARVPGIVPAAPVRTVFIGSGRFGVEPLRRLGSLEQRRVVELVGIVTAPPKPVGRKQTITPTPVADAARELHWGPVLAPDRLRAPEAIEEVLALRPELIVLVDYGQIVPATLLEVPHGAINLHPSLLPRHRGATPIPAAILAGDQRTGVTLIRMDQGLDTGPILAQAAVELTGRETSPVLEEILELVGADLLERSIEPWIRGEIAARPQPEDGATVTRPLRREDGRLDPSRTAAELERQVRAYVPWPGSYLETPIGRLIVHETVVRPGAPGDEPGSLVAADDGIALVTDEGRLLLTRLQLAGARAMDGPSLRRGAPALIGKHVGLR